MELAVLKVQPEKYVQYIVLFSQRNKSQSIHLAQ